MILKMFGQKFWFFVAVMICFESCSVYGALSAEEKASIKEAVRPFLLECMDEFGLTEAVIMELKNKGNEANVDPCFISCCFKKTGVFTANGMYDIEKAKALTTPFIKNEETLKIIDKIRQECLKVNDEKFSDGEKGCERAKALYKCFREHKKEADLDQ